MLGTVRLRQVLVREPRLELRSAYSPVIGELGDSEPVLSRAIYSGASSLQDRGRRLPLPTLSAGKPTSALCPQAAALPRPKRSVTATSSGQS